MGDLIILECENCGARLEFSDKRDVYYCEHCGYKHVYQKTAADPADEVYAACPLCSKNDKAQRIRTMQYSPPKMPNKPNDVFRDPYKEKSIVIPVLLIFGGILFYILIHDSEFLCCIGIPSIVLILFGIIQGALVITLNRNNMTTNETARKRWEAKTMEYNRISPVFDRIMEFWDELYYCERDDIMYIRDYEDYTTRDDMYAYIEKKALEEAELSNGK